MARPAKSNAGVIGLGLIGSRVAANLRKGGYQVWVWNRSPRPEPNFLSSPAEVAESAKIIQIFVSDGPALIQTVQAMAPALGPGHVVLHHLAQGNIGSRPHRAGTECRLSRCSVHRKP